MSRIHIKKTNKWIILILVLLLLSLLLISLALGRYPVRLTDVFQAIFLGLGNKKLVLEDTIVQVVCKVRLPRVLAAILVGSALSTSGACYQGMFRNPMVSPSLLGVSSGAGFGAALGILFNLRFIGVQGFAFIFGLLAVILVYLISSLLAKKSDMTLTLILTGTVMSSLFTSLLSLLKFVADPYNDLPAITFWLMGSLSNVTMNQVKIVFIIIGFGIAVLYSVKWKMNILSFGEKEALSLGLDANKMRWIIVFFSTLITAAAVSISGLIGWVGLVVPHLARMLVGPNYKYLFPASVLLGGIYMLAIDDLSRTLFAVEVPLGILTSIIGTPFFVYLLAKGKKGWN